MEPHHHIEISAFLFSEPLALTQTIHYAYTFYKEAIEKRFVGFLSTAKKNK